MMSFLITINGTIPNKKNGVIKYDTIFTSVFNPIKNALKISKSEILEKSELNFITNNNLKRRKKRIFIRYKELKKRKPFEGRIVNLLNLILLYIFAYFYFERRLLSHLPKKILSLHFLQEYQYIQLLFLLP